MTLGDCQRGDRVRLPDALTVELAWPFWWHGTKKRDQGRVRPDAWFVRVIEDDFVGEYRSEPHPLDADLVISEVIREAGFNSSAPERPGDFDPLLPNKKGTLL